jgi:molybdopterin-guanine dinucleotide biosynthesis protein A
VGAVIAGGRGERMGGAKATAPYRGRPLVEQALAQLGGLVTEAVVVAKPATPLPPLPGVAVWHDDEPGFHPRHGIATALRRAGGAPVLVVAVDLPEAHRALGAVLDAAARSGGAAVARAAGGRLQPLCGLYPPEARGVLEAAAADEPLTRTVERLRPAIVDVPPEWLRNVNRPEDLERAGEGP